MKDVFDNMKTYDFADLASSDISDENSFFSYNNNYGNCDFCDGCDRMCDRGW